MNFYRLILPVITLTIFVYSCGDDDSGTPEPDPTASFTWVADGTNVLQITFTNESTNAVSYQWDFGDGNTSTVASPVHSYDTGDEYTVTLTATNDEGVSDTFSETITVDSPVNPVAAFTFEVDEVNTLLVSFTNQSSDAISYSWDFGDGNTSTDENPTHNYAADGDFTVTLTASDDIGGSDMFSQTVTVTSPPQPIANFEFVQDETGILRLTFTNLSSDADTYEWDFGDTNTSNEESPVHKYESAGDFTITLTATNAFGSDTHTETISLNEFTMLLITERSTGNVFAVNTSSGELSFLMNFEINSETLTNIRALAYNPFTEKIYMGQTAAGHSLYNIDPKTGIAAFEFFDSNNQNWTGMAGLTILSNGDIAITANNPVLDAHVIAIFDQNGGLSDVVQFDTGPCCGFGLTLNDAGNYLIGDVGEFEIVSPTGVTTGNVSISGSFTPSISVPDTHILNFDWVDGVLYAVIYDKLNANTFIVTVNEATGELTQVGDVISSRFHGLMAIPNTVF